MRKQEFPAASLSSRIRTVLVTFILTDIAWVCFASDSLRHACRIFKQMFTVFETTGIGKIGLDKVNWFLLWSGIGVLFIVDLIHEKGYSVFSLVNRQELWFRWVLYLGLIWSGIMFGIYGVGYDTSQFIYFQF